MHEPSNGIIWHVTAITPAKYDVANIQLASTVKQRLTLAAWPATPVGAWKQICKRLKATVEDTRLYYMHSATEENRVEAMWTQDFSSISMCPRAAVSQLNMLIPEEARS
eukprot:481680-Amphidinium_carterae.1